MTFGDFLLHITHFPCYFVKRKYFTTGDGSNSVLLWTFSFFWGGVGMLGCKCFYFVKWWIFVYLLCVYSRFIYKRKYIIYLYILNTFILFKKKQCMCSRPYLMLLLKAPWLSLVTVNVYSSVSCLFYSSFTSDDLSLLFIWWVPQTLLQYASHIHAHTCSILCSGSCVCFEVEEGILT